MMDNHQDKNIIGRSIKGFAVTSSKTRVHPIEGQISNPNTDTLLLNSPNGQQSINHLYSSPTSKTEVHHEQTLMNKHTPEYINNLYELPSV